MKLIKETNLKKELCKKLIDEGIVKEGDVIRHSYSSNRLENGEKNMGRIENHDGLSPTLDTRCDCLGVVVNETIKIKNANKKGFLEANNGDGIDISSRMESHRGTVQKGCSQTLTCMGGNDVGTVENLRIRKLTPKETTRLMGFQDCDHDAMRSIGLSDNAVWHICGDSIVVPVLIGIFSQLFEEDKHIDIINNYIDTIKKEGE